MKYFKKNPLLWILPFNLLNLFLIPLTDNEAYYWLWAKNPDFSYFDHPPLQAWLTAISNYLIGMNPLSIRIWAIGSSIASLFLLFFYLRKKSEEAAWFACALLVSSPMFIAFSIFAVPDILFGLLGIGVLISVNSKKYTLTGVLLGLAALAKWHSVILVPGIIYTVYREEDFKVAVKYILWIGLICVLMQAPIVYWNYTHDWVSFKFQILDRHQGREFLWSKFPRRFAYYAGALLGLAGPLLIWATLKFKREKNNKYLVEMLWWTVPCMLLFLKPAMMGLYRFYWLSWTIIPFVIYLSRVVTPTPNILRKAIAFNIGIQVIWLVLILTPIAEFTRDKFVDFSDRKRPDWFLLRMSYPIQDFVENTILKKDKKGVIIVWDFHLASNLSWMLRHYPDFKVYPVGKKHQFDMWEMPKGEPTYLIMEKEKHFGLSKRLAKYCPGTPVWQTKSYTNSYELKKIRWARCSVN